MKIRKTPIIKICGITSCEDAEQSVCLGATAIGLNFYPRSPRCIDEQVAGRILSRIPEHVLTVGVFVGTPIPELASRFDVVQLHGLSSEKEVPRLKQRTWIATGPDQLALFPHSEIVIDVSWGTGKKADWRALTRIERPFVLSSGLTPDNVEEAILLLRPLGVDVCSGVEFSPGVKDPDKLERFIQTAVSAFTKLASDLTG